MNKVEEKKTGRHTTDGESGTLEERRTETRRDENQTFKRRGSRNVLPHVRK